MMNRNISFLVVNFPNKNIKYIPKYTWNYIIQDITDRLKLNLNDIISVTYYYE